MEGQDLQQSLDISLTTSRTPGQLIRKRLLKNKPAVFGLIAIIAALFVSIFAYTFIPDNTPHANDGHIELKKLTPFSTVNFISTPTIPNTKTSFIVKLFSGFPAFDKKTPIDSSKQIDHNIILYTYRGLGKYTDTLQVSGQEIKSTSSTYLLGTDQAGRDVLSRLILGTRISLSIGFIAVLISLLIGVSIGACAGYFRGWIDQVLMWFTTVIWSIPGIMLVISISIALESSGIWVTFMAVGLTMWVEVARVVRGQFIEIREKSFVEAAQTLGASSFHIIRKHILPNILGPIIVIATSNFAAAILIEAGLSFLGLGVQPPTPSWGLMVHEGFQLMGTKNSWHLILFPSLAISILVLAFNLLGNGLRDAFDPKSN